MPKLIFISGTPISSIVGEKLNYELYEKNGFTIEYWDLTRLYYSEEALGLYFGGHKKFKFKFPVERKFYDKREVEKALQLIRQKVVFCHTDFNIHDDYWLRRLFKKYDICYYTGPRRTSERFAWHKGEGLDITAFFHKAVSVIKVRARISYLKQKFQRLIYTKTNIYQKPAFVVGSGTLGRREFLDITQAQHFVSVPSTDLVWEPLTKLFKNRYCVCIDDAVVYSPDQSMLKDKQSTCNDLSIYSKNICNVFNLIEKVLKCQVVIAASGKYHYRNNEIFGGREIVYAKTNQLIQHAELVIGHASSATWQVIVDKKPIMFLWDPSFIKAKNVAVTLQAAFLGVAPIMSTRLTPSDINNALNIDQMKYAILLEKFFCEKDVKGTVEELVANELEQCLIGQYEESQTLTT